MEFSCSFLSSLQCFILAVGKKDSNNTLDALQKKIAYTKYFILYTLYDGYMPVTLVIGNRCYILIQY